MDVTRVDEAAHDGPVRRRRWTPVRDERKSELWKYAKVDYVDEQKLLVCNVDLGGRVCGQSFAWTGSTSLSNFRRHMRKRHPEVRIVVPPPPPPPKPAEEIEEEVPIET
eukprot:jgi/Pico_ML_1/52846/g3493.t1